MWETVAQNKIHIDNLLSHRYLAKVQTLSSFVSDWNPHFLAYLNHSLNDIINLQPIHVGKMSKGESRDKKSIATDASSNIKRLITYSLLF